MISKFFHGLFLFFATCAVSTTQAQQLNAEIWKTIYSDIELQNDKYRLKLQFEDVYMVIDPYIWKNQF